MKNFKVIQKVFNLQNQFDDLIDEKDIILVQKSCDIVDYSVSYFFTPMTKLIYPSKSFSVAIIYAHLIEVFFFERFKKSLDDCDLFCGNDKFFVPYSEAMPIYDEILKKMEYSKEFVFNTRLPQVKKTIECFYTEFDLK